MSARLAAIVALLALNGFFVGAEAALSHARRQRLEALARSGDRKARLALRAMGRMPRILAACQLGSTLASLGLGILVATALVGPAAAALARLPWDLARGTRGTLALIAVLLVVGTLHVVLGALAPRGFAGRHPERLARWLAPPVLAVAWLLAPLLRLVDRAAVAALRVAGPPAGQAESAHSPEELRQLVEESHESGALQREDAALLEGVFEFSEKSAREVMTPRTEIVGLPLDATLDAAVAIVEEGRFSRYPVCDGTIDEIVGVVLAKDLLTVIAHPPPQFSLASIMRPVHMIPGSREVEDVLADFKRRKEHLAIVLDEHGGTAGLVTMEDLLEEIVGEILDEHDEPETPRGVAEAGHVLVAGTMPIADLNERYGLAIPELDAATIGGFVFGTLGRLPAVGDRVTAGGAVFHVRLMDGRRIETLAVDLHSAGDRREQVREQVREKGWAQIREEVRPEARE